MTDEENFIRRLEAEVEARKDKELGKAFISVMGPIWARLDGVMVVKDVEVGR